MSVDVQEYAKDIKKLFGNRVLILPQEIKETITSSGLIIRANAQKKTICGTVIAIGPGQFYENGDRVPMTVKPGDNVIYNKFTAFDAEVNGHEYVIVQEEDIIAIDEEGELVMQLKVGLL